ncbi:MAG: hypothetical protein AAFU85_17370 [Planctomycetota bacterium]
MPIEERDDERSDDPVARTGPEPSDPSPPPELAEWIERGERRPSTIWLIVVSCLGFLVADFLAASSFEDAFPALLIINVLTAQLTLLCVWGTLVHGTFWMRLPWTLLLLLVSWCAIAVGRVWHDSSASFEELLGIGLLWSIGFTVSFIPLKVAALAFDWKIANTPRRVEELNQFSIRDILVVTFVIALIMGIGRALIPDRLIEPKQILRAVGLNRWEPVFALSLFGVISLMVKLPCIWIALAQKRHRLAASIAIWSGYCFLLTILELVIISALLGLPGDEGGFVMGALIGHQVMGGLVLTVCVSLRGLGYRLNRARGIV